MLLNPPQRPTPSFPRSPLPPLRGPRLYPRSACAPPNTPACSTARIFPEFSLCLPMSGLSVRLLYSSLAHRSLFCLHSVSPPHLSCPFLPVPWCATPPSPQPILSRLPCDGSFPPFLMPRTPRSCVYLLLSSLTLPVPSMCSLAPFIPPLWTRSDWALFRRGWASAADRAEGMKEVHSAVRIMRQLNRPGGAAFISQSRRAEDAGEEQIAGDLQRGRL